jgi:hypothetical protein
VLPVIGRADAAEMLLDIGRFASGPNEDASKIDGALLKIGKRHHSSL